MGEVGEFAAWVLLQVSRLLALLLIIVGPLMWTVHRVLRPVDRAARERNLPFRFSIGDFLCLFWIVEIPLAFVYRVSRGQTNNAGDDGLTLYFWILTAAVWVVAPLAWFTVARALSKAGISAGPHRMIFLGAVLPTVYYGLFAFIGLSVAIAAGVADIGLGFLNGNTFIGMWWFILGASLLACGFYSPWLVRHATAHREDELDQRASFDDTNSSIETRR